MKIYLDALSIRPTVSIGSQAFILGSMKIIKNYYNNAQFTMLSAFPEMDKMYCSKGGYDVNFVKRTPSQYDTIKKIQSIVKQVDAIVSVWGDGYITISPHKILYKTSFLKSKSKPLILFPSSIGPFKGNIKRYLAKKGLEKFDRLMARDTITFNYLKELGIKNVDLIPDVAFVLDRASDTAVGDILKKEKIPIEDKYIGLNISQLLNYLFKVTLGLDYVKLMVDVINTLRRKTRVRILLIPHQIYPSFCHDDIGTGMTFSRGGDDRYVIRQIMERINPDKEMVNPILGEYSSAEYKGIIGKCTIFIGGRMHSIIAALSCGVPSVIMQYSHKASGTMSLLGLEEYVWDFKGAKEELLSKIMNLWDSHEALKENVKAIGLKAQEDAWKAGTILKEELDAVINR